MNQRQYNFDRIQRAILYMEANFKQQPSLEQIAREIHVSPFHFQKLFVDWVGISPKKFMQFTTLSYLRTRLRKTENMLSAAEEAGLSSSSRVHDLFLNIEAVSPQEFKSSGQDLQLYYGFHPSPFGLCFLVVSTRGISELSFIDPDSKEAVLKKIQKKWEFASISYDHHVTETYLSKIFPTAVTQPEKLELFVQGSSFQLKVWEALVNIPVGTVCSYQQLAQGLGNPRAERIVASAAGQNPISYLIPCHRVVRGDGDAGTFYDGKARKKVILAWEMAQQPEEAIDILSI